MRNLILLTTIFFTACYSANNPLDTDNSGTLTLDVNIVNAAEKNSEKETTIKSTLIATIFDNSDQPVKSWNDLNHLPDKIPLALGTYYVVVASEETVSKKENAFSYYAKTDMVQIDERQNQSISLTFNDHFSFTGYSDISF